MKYKAGTELIRKETKQKFRIDKIVLTTKGFRYLLKGPHWSLNLEISKKELDDLFSVA